MHVLNRRRDLQTHSADFQKKCLCTIHAEQLLHPLRSFQKAFQASRNIRGAFDVKKYSWGPKILILSAVILY